MWEIDIIIDYRYRKYLLYLKENITSSQHYNHKGVFAIIKIGNNAILSIAIMDIDDNLKSEIKEWIAECVVFSEKERYILASQTLPNNIYKHTFLKALVMVDMAEDVKIVSSHISLEENTINLHSLFKFRLNNLEKKWCDMLAKFFPKNESLDDGKIMEILRNITECNRTNEILLVKRNSDNYIIESIVSNTYITAQDDTDLIANLILLSPQKILISCTDNISTDSMILLSYLFGNIIQSN